MAYLSRENAVASLVQRGVPLHVAQGVVMNFQDESGLNTGIQEKAPIAGRGGYGLAQWTGPRRVALENYAAQQGKPIDDPDLQLDFFMSENQGPEAAAWKKVMSAPTAQDAAVAFVQNWERPAAEHVASRSARYLGTGPAEGAAKFGGTGLGTPAVPATDSPSEKGGAKFGGTGKVVAKVDAKKKSGKWDKIGDALSGAMSGFGGSAQTPVLGAGGNAPQMPAQAPVPMESMPIVAGGAADAQRNQLALLMQRLNSQTLW